MLCQQAREGTPQLMADPAEILAGIGCHTQDAKLFDIVVF